jgi:type II secretory pathway predicted ATPase ExeA
MSFEDFGLREDPFSRSARPRYPFVSCGYRQAIGELYYHLDYGPRILGVASASGVGRTTLLLQLESRMQASSSTLFLSPECCHLEYVLRLLAADREIADRSRRGGQRRDAEPPSAPDIEASRKIVLFVDDAHKLDDPSLLAVRSLLRVEAGKENRVRIVLGGSPEIVDRLIGDDLRQDFHGVSISPLTAGEVERYIAHRLRLAGWRGPAFSSDACEAIAVLSQGVCAKINDLCSAALLTAAERRPALIDASFFPRIASKSSAAPVPKAPAIKRKHGSRLAVAVPAYAIASLVLTGLWYERDWRPRPIAVSHMSGWSSDNRSDDSAAIKRLSDAPNNDAPSLTIAPNTPVKGMPPSPPPSSRAGVHADAKISSRAPAISVARIAAHVSTSTPADIPVVQRTNPPRSAETHEIAKAVAPASAIAPSRPPSAATPPPAAPIAKAPIPPNGEGKNRVTPASAESRPTALALEQASFETRLGDTYMRLGEYDNAIRSFHIALGLTPGDQEIEQRIQRARHAKAAEESTLR